MEVGKLIGLVLGVIAIVGSVYMVGDALKDVEDAQKWLAYGHGVCRFVDGYTEEEYLAMGGEVIWATMNGKQAYIKYYSEPGSWVYGENPRLGEGIGQD